jgi:uncharacterized membrane protein YphA (DoxX/SURF4 family)
MISLEHIASLWERFFFEPVPVYSIAVFRILLGCILLLDAIFVLSNVELYLGPRGLTEYHRYFKSSHGKALSLFLYLPPTRRSAYLVIGMHLIFVSMMTLGFLTPFSTALTFVTTRSIVNRSAATCNGGDNVAKLMCFLLIFSPAGHALSLDTALFFAQRMPGGEYLNHEPWVLRLMQIEVSIIYLRTVYWKLKGATWRNGTALHYVAANQMYRRLQIPAILLRTPVVQALTWGVLVVECVLGVGLWIEDFRRWLIVAGIALHAGIEGFLNVHLFGWYMIACLFLFLKPNWILVFL